MRIDLIHLTIGVGSGEPAPMVLAVTGLALAHACVAAGLFIRGSAFRRWMERRYGVRPARFATVLLLLAVSEFAMVGVSYLPKGQPRTALIGFFALGFLLCFAATVAMLAQGKSRRESSRAAGEGDATLRDLLKNEDA